MFTIKKKKVKQNGDNEKIHVKYSKWNRGSSSEDVLAFYFGIPVAIAFTHQPNPTMVNRGYLSSKVSDRLFAPL